MAKKPPTIEEVLRLRHLFNKPLSIIPLLVKTKMPARKWTRVINGEPFADHELVEFWSTSMNPGIAMGRFSGPGLVAVDCDNQAGIDFCAANIPQTRMQTWTRVDGRHLIYRIDGDARVRCGTDVLGSKAKFIWEAREQLGLNLTVSQSRDQTEEQLAAERDRVAHEWELALTKMEMGPIIDIRGDGGQVVAPGAVRPDGSEYRMVEQWTQRMLDEDVPFFDWRWFEGKKWQRPGSGPVKVSDLAAKRGEKALERAREATPETKIKRARAWLEKVEGAVAGAGGQNKLFYVACRLCQGFLVDTDTAYQTIMTEYNPRCQPAWSEEEVAHKVIDAAQNAGQNAGYMLVDRPGFHKKVNDMQSMEASASDFELDDLIPGPPAVDDVGQPPPSEPQVLQMPGATTELTEDDKYWMRRWENPFGVDYLRLKQDRVIFGAIKNDGVWTLPPTPLNVCIVLTYSRLLSHKPRFNELKRTIEDQGQGFSDRDQDMVKHQLDRMWAPKNVAEDTVAYAARFVAFQNAFEPAQEWLLALPEWDGVRRLERVPEDILGAGPEPVLGVMYRHFMTSLCARIMDPGIKVDTMLFLVSANQGAGKSKFLKLLIDGNLKPGGWFTDNPFSLKDKDGRMLIGTNLLVEWSEGEHAKSAKMIDIVKAFLSQQEDEFRDPYGRYMLKRPRRCVFTGTSNDEGLLHDPSGSRRFYIIRTADKIDLKKLLVQRDQLYAEALDLFRRHQAAVEDDGEWNATRWWFSPEEDLARQRLVSEFQSRSAWFEDIANWVEARAATKQPLFTIDEVIEKCLRVTIDNKNMKQVMEVRATLIQLGCKELGRMVVDKRRGRWWQPPSREVADDLPM